MDIESFLAHLHRVDELLTDRALGIPAHLRVVDVRETAPSGAQVEPGADRAPRTAERARR